MKRLFGLGGLGLYTLSVVLFCALIFPKASTALDDFNMYRYGDDAKIKIERKEFIVKFVIYDTEEELQDEFFDGEKPPEGLGVRAFTMVSPSSDVCYIHLKLAKIWDDRESMAILGHELYHCALAEHEIANLDGEEEISDDGYAPRPSRYSEETKPLRDECEYFDPLIITVPPESCDKSKTNWVLLEVKKELEN